MNAFSPWFLDSEAGAALRKVRLQKDREQMMTALLFLAAAAAHSPARDRDIVAELDSDYQAAVKRNDAAAMDRILHPDFQLVIGTGRRSNRQDLLREARSGSVNYEVQDEETGSQKVLVTGNTAIVTAKLRIKGTLKGEPFDRTLWFSDTYVRTSSGWLYFFGQASLPLPSAQQ